MKKEGKGHAMPLLTFPIVVATLFTVLLARGCSKSFIVCADGVIAVVRPAARGGGGGDGDEGVDLTAR